MSALGASFGIPPAVGWVVAAALVLPGLGCAGSSAPSVALARAVSLAIGSAPANRFHVVEPGDTVWAVAGGRRSCADAILAASRIPDATRIRPGQRLTIPVRRCPEEQVAAAPAREKPPVARRAAPRRAPASPTPVPRAAPEVVPDVAAAPVVAVSSPPPSAPLVTAEAELRAARFEEALAAAEALIREVGPSPGSRGSELSRAHLVAATVHVALADRRAARSHLARALDLDPALQLDPARTSPKVLEVLDEERTRREVRIAQREVAPR